jgi:triphosphoribosyl-dephospho-CoA synthase
MHDLMAASEPRSRRGDVPAIVFCPGARNTPRKDNAFCAKIGRLAVRSLYAELTLYPKPGLVSLIDNGSHDDMTAATFMRSLFSLRRYFIRITRAGMEDAAFSKLKQLGIEAEQQMLIATKGINTHRGAIFCLGLLCAAIGRCQAQGFALSAQAIRSALLKQWGESLATHMQSVSDDSHGLQAAARYATSGAREEGALGFPSVFEVGLPSLRRTLAAGRSTENARVDALFSLMGHISDTNVYHRGGEVGAQTVKRYARHFLGLGGTANPGWELCATECHRVFINKRLSPGGAADLLAAACLIDAVSRFA